MSISAVHIRMLRAAFRFSVRGFAKRVGVSKGTVVSLEAGGGTWSRTAERLQAVFGELVEVVEETEEHGPGLILKKGWEKYVQEDDDEGRVESSAGSPGDIQAATLSEDEQTILLRYYRERPERWRAMSDAGREAILQSMGREAL